MSAAGDETAAKPQRGAFIVLEGLDRSGKTTQVKLLEQKFVEQGRSVKLMRFPDRTTQIGKMIDSYLKSAVRMDDHAIHLLFSANRWEAAEGINAVLESGTTIVCDRYTHSGMVYSAAKGSPALRLPWARAPDVGLPRPDRVVFLDLDEETARARGGWGDEVYEKAEMQRQVRRLFGALGRGGRDEDGGLVEGVTGEMGWLEEEKGDLRMVDARGTVEEVAERVWEVVDGVQGVRRVLS
ncbi:Thymidylate kinase [Akanthomyces lecanii RCEF 1005]|uniref:Thymidylate kinase n=1 Tax=Akanthomyces lecanii RCEF 1005 TaxID=1081108 RepID=A0A162IW08_CORDF|nr:Thymidylate kinase [Akanthomyces lecanii RCEF 1005]